MILSVCRNKVRRLCVGKWPAASCGGFFYLEEQKCDEKNRIRELRVREGVLSQAELAKRSGCELIRARAARTRSNPAARVPLDVGLKIAIALGVPAEALIADQELVPA